MVDFKEAQKDIEIINNIIVEQLKIQNLKHPNKTDKFERAPLPYKQLDDGRVQFHFKTKFKPKLVDDKKNIIQRFIDRVRKILGLKPMTDREVIDFMNTIFTN